jgi:hypothetical protein
MHDAQTFAVEILAPGDLVGLAQCIALDADAFPYASLPFGLAGARIRVARAQVRAGVLGFVGGSVRAEALYIHGLAVIGGLEPNQSSCRRSQPRRGGALPIRGVRGPTPTARLLSAGRLR